MATRPIPDPGARFEKQICKERDPDGLLFKRSKPGKLVSQTKDGTPAKLTVW
jgi:hypothetical protein